MEDIEKTLKECRLAAAPEDAGRRAHEGRRPARRPNWSRRYWAAMAAAVLLVIGLSVWTESGVSSSPYGSSVVAAGDVPPHEPWEVEHDLIALLGDAGRDYLIHVGVIRNGS